MRLPEKFIKNMQKQLPESEWEDFFSVYEKKPFKGVRLNPLRGDVNEIKSKLPFLGGKVDWEEYGFYTDNEKLGASPYHSAGVFYAQEPTAMSIAPLLDVQPGERALDLCSAPGGKGTQLACRMAGKGLIILNEPIFSRAKILSQNVERMGITNAMVTSELPENLSDKFMGYFDKILIDAPCSGEGMFRKNAQEALAEWSEENITLCIERQRKILDEGTKMLKVGGKLAYSTCTFAYDEDEGQVFDYLKNHPQMRLLKQEKLYPHKVQGEGHFLALFEKVEADFPREVFHRKTFQPKVRKESEKAERAFEKAFFRAPYAKRLHEVGEVLYELPEEILDWKGVQVLRVGVRLGEMKNGRFEPNHSLAMTLKAGDCKRALMLSATDNRVEKYLRGETIECDLDNGWCLVCVDEYPLGLGKVVQGTVKNHLPKGLRQFGVHLAQDNQIDD